MPDICVLIENVKKSKGYLQVWRGGISAFDQLGSFPGSMYVTNFRVQTAKYIVAGIS